MNREHATPNVTNMRDIDLDEIVEDMRKEALTWDQHTLEAVFFGRLSGKYPVDKFRYPLSVHIRNKYGFWKCTWTPERKGEIDYSQYHPDNFTNTIIEKIIELGPYETNE